MVTEHAVILDLNDVVLIVWVLFLEMLQDAEFNAGLMLIALFVFDNLESDNLASLVIKAL